MEARAEREATFGRRRRCRPQAPRSAPSNSWISFVDGCVYSMPRASWNRAIVNSDGGSFDLRVAAVMSS
eukprot:5790090-Pyramimonas_sp.AAC.1